MEKLAEVFFARCLENNVTPHVVTKKTVFKWQEPFSETMKFVFKQKWQHKFEQAGLLEATGGKLSHLISDNATMQILRWRDGGFGLAMHN